MSMDTLANLYVERYLRKSKAAQESCNLPKDSASPKYKQAKHSPDKVKRIRAMNIASSRLPKTGGWRVHLQDMAESIDLPYWTAVKYVRNKSCRRDGIPEDYLIDSYEAEFRKLHAIKRKMKASKSHLIADTRQAVEQHPGSQADKIAYSKELGQLDELYRTGLSLGIPRPLKYAEAESLILRLYHEQKLQPNEALHLKALADKHFNLKEEMK